MIPALHQRVTENPSTRFEARRKFAVRWVYFIYVLMLIEGPLRKWFLPGLAGPLTVLRDPFVIALYGYCLANRLMLRRGIAEKWLGFAVAASIFGLLQYANNGFGLTGWALGLRSYWLYMPLAFVIARCFTYNDLIRFLRVNMWIAIPYATLVATQYSSGAGSFINWGVGADEGGSLGLSDGIVRPFGLFSYTAPNVQFTSAVIAMFLALYLTKRTVQPSLPIFFVMMLSVAAMGVLTGSRSIYFEVAIMIVGTIIALLMQLHKKGSLRQIVSLIGFLVVAAVVFVQLFPDMLQAMGTRFEVAARSEGSFGNRIYYNIFSFVEAYATAPFLGHGIGAGAPGVSKVIGLPNLIYGEGDLTRNVNELGIVLGSLFLILRFMTGAWVMWLALKLAFRGYRLTLPIGAFVGLNIMTGQITNSPLIAFLPWLLFGCILVCKTHADHARAERLAWAHSESTLR